MHLKRHTHVLRGSIFFFYFFYKRKVARCIAIDICPPLLSTGAHTTFFFLTVRPSDKQKAVELPAKFSCSNGLFRRMWPHRYPHRHS